jgi:hypothetical protein
MNVGGGTGVAKVEITGGTLFTNEESALRCKTSAPTVNSVKLELQSTNAQGKLYEIRSNADGSLDMIDRTGSAMRFSISSDGSVTIPGIFKPTNTTASVSSSTGALVVSGGLGIAGRCNIASALAIGVNRATALSALEVVGAGGLCVTDGGASTSVKQFQITYDSASNVTRLLSIQQGVGQTPIYIDSQNIGYRTLDFGSGTGCFAIANCGSAPSSKPVGGGVLFAEGGALKWKGPSGVVTIVGAA